VHREIKENPETTDMSTPNRVLRRQRQTGVSRGRDLFGKLATVEAGLTEAQFTEAGLWIDRCWRKAPGAGVLRDRNDLMLLRDRAK
jgi:hypothetical protein